MRVFINAVSIKEGGSLGVLARLLAAMRDAREDIEWMVAVPPQVVASVGGRSRVSTLSVSIDQSPHRMLAWYEFALPKALRSSRADVLFSMTNYLPRRSLSCPTLLLEQHAGHFSKEFDDLTLNSTSSLLGRMSWRQKRRWVRRSVRAADVLTVQTAALANAVSAVSQVPRDQIRVVPHGPGWVEQAPMIRPPRAEACCRIGYITKWGVQKNFGTLFSAIRVLNLAGLPVKLILTLDPRGPGASVLSKAYELGVGALVENHGELGPDAVTALYDSLDVFVFPSTCESFGFPMVEAMARGLPIVVADTPGNREVTAGAGLPFSAYDADALAAVLSGLLSDRRSLTHQAALSLERGRQFSWTTAAEGTIAALEAAAVMGHG